ncbi:hypothetical protein DEE92_27480, partial [Ralstonia pickettii]|uniref:hypothetical protein n=1 Tax=Ralstonia pickettii TaxID=329 RepID=UPI001C71A508
AKRVFPFPSLRHKFKGKSPSRARLSFAYFSLARQRKVSQPRQGMKQGMNRPAGTRQTKNQATL